MSPVKPKKHIESTSQTATLEAPVKQEASETKPSPIIQELDKLSMKQMEDSKLVKGTFIYRSSKGGVYTCRLRKYRGDPLAPRKFVDGQDYVVPLWVARWLNGDPEEFGCAEVIHSPRADSGAGAEVGKITQSGMIEGNTNLINSSRREAVFQFVIKEYM
jgi:hypothetical protein